MNTTMKKYAKVASRDFAGAGFDYLDYDTADINLSIGDLVAVPFGGRIVTGFVINLSDRTEAEKIFPVYEKIEQGNTLTPELLDLASYVSKTYMCPLSRVILSVVPPMLTNRVKEYYSISETEEFTTPKEKEILERIGKNGAIAKPDASDKRVIRSLVKKGFLVKNYRLEKPKAVPKLVKSVKLAENLQDSLTDRQKILADYLKGKDFIPCQFIIKNGIGSAAVINTLVKNKVLLCENKREDRLPSYTYIAPSDVTLTQCQQKAFDTVSAGLSQNKNEVFLLFGVTASGKTEVYIRLIEQTVKSGKTALVLLPEIALTTQVMNIFRSRFGKLVAVLHSALSSGERLDEWDRIKEGKAKIVLGARSAVFAPLENIGLVIVDEEHDGGYKQDTQPKYHTRDLAVYRAKKNRAVCLLGSATPSVESYYKATTGEYTLINMPERVTGRQLPNVYMADLKESKYGTLVSPMLHEKIKDRLIKGEQVILLQNRRAYSTYILCPDCAWVAKCENCDVSLKFHIKSNMLVCHHCGYAIKKPEECPDCHGKYIRAYGTGTQKVEEYIKYNFPSARVLRMDRDSVTGKETLGAILNAFREHKADILVGTQMVAKGLDFPLVTLVGAINADIDLNMPDFRSGERAFQLINQVTGRAGRGTSPGEVIIQTYNPDNSVLQFAKKQDYTGFFEEESKNRKALDYPPYSRIIKASVQGKEMNELKNLMESFAKILNISNTDSDKMIIYPPMPAIIPKVNNIYRVNMMIKVKDMDYGREKILAAVFSDIKFRKRINFDIDPMFLD